MISCVFGANSLLSTISSLTVIVNPSLPAPDPYEITKILSPGFAISNIEAKPNGVAPEYVLPIFGVSNPCLYCSSENPNLINISFYYL